jgi:hypothetical protein
MSISTESIMIPLSPELKIVLKLCSGLCWTIAYILIIRRGFIDKTYGMPVVALCANISWEFIFSFIYPHETPQLQINRVWFLFDTLIFYQVLRRGDSLFFRPISRAKFLIAFPVIVALSFCAVLFITYEFNDYQGRYTAFGQNFMMSVLFVAFLVNRGASAGQSLYIALFKMIGTILPSILFFCKFPSSWFLTYLYITILFFDGVYAVLLYRQLRLEGKSPWRWL